MVLCLLCWAGMEGYQALDKKTRKVLAERKRRKAIEKGELPADVTKQAAHPAAAAAGSAEKSQAYHAETSTTTPIEAPPAYEQAVTQR